ncbi:MAG TPA: glycosyltransferase, partial [Candidatus Rothia avicola]|nr:glycosyltransferase [Candidatus Rothia avicola]
FFSLSLDEKNNKLVFVDPGCLYKWNGRLYLAERSVLGYKAYFDYISHKSSNTDVQMVSHQGVIPAEEHVVKNLMEIPDEILGKISEKNLKEFYAENQGALFYALCNREISSVLGFNDKVFYLIENPRSVKTDLALTDFQGSLISKMKIIIGSYKEDLALKANLRRVAGFQANGDAAYESYRKFNSNSIVFYDHRVSEVPEKYQDENKNLDSSLRVAFSGRIIKIKGSEYLAEVSHLLYESNPAIRIYLLGDGEDREKILRGAAPNLEYKGFMSYKEEWEPFVRQNVDLMLLPHVQGDPSMTYFEALGAGVPIIGFKNQTLNHLVDKGLGWAYPQGDSEAIVKKILELGQHPKELSEKSQNALEFMRENLYPTVVKRRMDHLLASLKQ